MARISMNAPGKDVKREARRRSRRAFLTMGAAAAGAYSSWFWLRSRSQEGGLEWPLRGMLRRNEGVAEAYFSSRHSAPTFSVSQVDANTRKNGDVGLSADNDPEQWVLKVRAPGNADTRQITMAQIRELPRVQQTS